MTLLLKKRFFIPATIIAVVAIFLFFRDAAESQFQTGLQRYNNNDFGLASTYFMKAAKCGHLEAQDYLLGCYIEGTITDEDFAKTLPFYEKAAKSGHADAEYRYAVCCAEGLGREPDMDEAIEWLKKSSLQKFPPAMYWLGRCYLQGEVIAQNIQEGERLIEEAKELGYDEELEEIDVEEIDESDESSSENSGSGRLSFAENLDAGDQEKQKATVQNSPDGLPIRPKVKLSKIAQTLSDLLDRETIRLQQWKQTGQRDEKNDAAVENILRSIHPQETMGDAGYQAQYARYLFRKNDYITGFASMNEKDESEVSPISYCVSAVQLDDNLIPYVVDMLYRELYWEFENNQRIDVNNLKNAIMPVTTMDVLVKKPNPTIGILGLLAIGMNPDGFGLSWQKLSVSEEITDFVTRYADKEALTIEREWRKRFLQYRDGFLRSGFYGSASWCVLYSKHCELRDKVIKKNGLTINTNTSKVVDMVLNTSSFSMEILKRAFANQSNTIDNILASSPKNVDLVTDAVIFSAEYIMDDIINSQSLILDKNYMAVTLGQYLLDSAVLKEASFSPTKQAASGPVSATMNKIISTNKDKYTEIEKLMGNPKNARELYFRSANPNPQRPISKEDNGIWLD